MTLTLALLVLAPALPPQTPGLQLIYEDSLAPGLEFPLKDERFWFSERSEWSFVDSVADNGLGAPVPESGPALTFKSTKRYQPRVRSPHSLALLRGHELFGDYAFEVEAMQTGIETPHRDLVLVFGFESPEQFYYCHLGARPDATSSNIFEVSEAPRRRVGEISTKPIEWGRGVWHKLRVECSFKGNVRVFMDGAKEPHFEEELGRNPKGLVGFGSFDDAGAFRNLKVYAPWAKPSAWDPDRSAPRHQHAYWRTSPFGGVVTGRSTHTIEFVAGRSKHVVMLTDDKSWGFVTEARWPATRPAFSLPLDASYVSSDRLAIQPVLDEDGAFTAPYRFSVGTPAQSRSDFLRSEYDRRTGGHPAQGDWNWSVHFAARADEQRPTLSALTPHDMPESWRWDKELFSDPKVAERLTRDFVLRRFNPSPDSITRLIPFWAVTETGMPRLFMHAPGGGRLGTTKDLKDPEALLRWLDEALASTPQEVPSFREHPFQRR